MAEPELRHARADDLAAINELYNRFVRETAITFDVEPISLERRRAWFAGFAETGRHQLFVAACEARVLGYACTRPFREKAAYDTTVETSIYLDSSAQRRGLGRRLYERLLAAIEGADVHLAVAGITLPNDASVALHERCGFRRAGLLPEVGRKLDRYWDVLWMVRPLGGS